MKTQAPLRCIAGLAATLLLAACSSKPAPTIESLRLAENSYPGLIKVETRALYDRGRQLDRPDAPEKLQQIFRNSGIEATAQYRYTLSDARGATTLRTVVTWHTDAARAAKDFRGSHMPQALAETETLPIGEDAFAYKDEYIGFLVAPVTVEIRAKPPHPALRDLAAAYAKQIAATLKPQG